MVLLGHTLEYIFYFFSCKAILVWRCDGGVKKEKVKKRESSILILAPVQTSHLSIWNRGHVLEAKIRFTMAEDMNVVIRIEEK